MSYKENFSSWEEILATIDKKNKFKNRINKIGVNETGKPANFQLILTGEFKNFGSKLDKIIDNFLRFESENVKSQKIEEALLFKTIKSNSYTFEIAETIAIQILEFAEDSALLIDCAIKKDNNFIQM
jgi:hypothetical protein